MIERLKVIALQQTDINWFLMIRGSTPMRRASKIFVKCPCCVARIFANYLTKTNEELEVTLLDLSSEISSIQDQVSLYDLKDIIDQH